jgi:predicted mannosyl-3-phosphoglycerate phosphatase (HAD superfamily)
VTPVILTDLDDTLFTTMKGYREHDPAALRQASEAANGNHSWICPRREALLDWISAGATVIPVTARSESAYRRVKLDFTEGAILSNGAVILDRDGEEDLAWKRRTEICCRTAQAALEDVARIRSAWDSGGDWTRLLRHERDGVLLGVTVKSNIEREEDALAILAGFREVVSNMPEIGSVEVHLNGNNLGFVPMGISKRAAVEAMIANRPDLQGRPLVGAGDSVTDLPFMELCDFALIPRGTRNAARLFQGKSHEA